LIARLLAHKQDSGMLGPFAKHGLGSVLVKRTGGAM
jgi:hypothetical protein